MQTLLKELEEEYGLDKKGFDKLETLLKKRLGITSTLKEEKETKILRSESMHLKKKSKTTRRSKKLRSRSRRLRKRLRMSSTHSQRLSRTLRIAVSLPAITRYILSDKDNLTKSMEEIVREMYPKALGEKQSIDGYSGGADHSKVEIDTLDPQTDQKLRKDPNFRKASLTVMLLHSLVASLRSMQVTSAELQVYLSILMEHHLLTQLRRHLLRRTLLSVHS